MAPQYEIFRNSDGSLLARIFGYDNAVVNAQSYAAKLGEKIGISCNEEPAEYFDRPVSKYWKGSNLRLEALIEARDYAQEQIWVLNEQGREGSRDWSYQTGRMEALNYAIGLENG